MKKIIAAFIFASMLVSVSFTAYQVGAMPEKIDSEVDVKAFIEENQKHYSNLRVIAVPSYETKDSKTQKMVVVTHFGTWFKGGKIHLVSCVSGKDCATPEGRSLQLLDGRTDEEAEYYKSQFNN